MQSWGHTAWWGPIPLAGFGPLGFVAILLLCVFIIAEIALKGYALWYAAKRDQKWWFVIMLIVNTAGALEIIYLVFFVHKLHKRVAKHHGHEDRH